MRRIMSLRRCFGALLAVALTLSAVPVAADQAPLEFNYGIPTSDQIAIYVAQDLNLYEKVGLKPKFFLFQSGAPLIAGLKGDSLDVTTTGLAIMFALGQHIPLKLLFWVANDGIGEGLVVNPKSGIKSYKDINPTKKLAAASGTCAQVAAWMMAKKLNIPFEKMDIINIAAPLLHNAILSNSVDAGIAWPPYSYAAEAEGDPVVNFDPDYTVPGGDCPRLTAVRPDFLKAHPELGLKLVEVEAMAADAIAKNPQLAIDALTKRLGLTPAAAKADYERLYLRRPTFAQQLDTSSPYSLTSPNGLANKLNLASQALAATKSIPEPLSMNDINAAIDPTYLKQYMAVHKK
jgi:NitT/TauT family transport system substrate-binding protein